MAKDFYLDPTTNDIDLTNKTMRLTSSIGESSRQQVYISLSTFKGEWYANIMAGIPYLANDNNVEQLMGQTQTTNLDIAVKNDILNRENITSISSYSSVFDREVREANVSFTAITNTDEEISIENFPVPL